MRTFFCSSFIGLAIILLGAISVNALPPKSNFTKSPGSSIQKEDPSKFLREIYDEVQELGRLGNDNFIKREFLLNLDNNESNKEEHVVVLSHCLSGREMMLLQVTYFESRRTNSPVKYAKTVREIECCVLDTGIEIQRCDYLIEEIRTLLPNILQGIRETKRYLNRIR